ncbi:MAG: hypothetical protein ACWGKN_02065 [Desulfoprunum sp.]
MATADILDEVYALLEKHRQYPRIIMNSLLSDYGIVTVFKIESVYGNMAAERFSSA